MRITKSQIQTFIHVISHYLSDDQSAELRLYGSRTDIHKKGGDIDLLLLVKSNKARQSLISNKHHILANIKKEIGDQKIDILIAEINDLNSDPFLQMIYPSSTLLYQWQASQPKPSNA